ncbi:hypothetical protein FQR65_LT01907 [Abscondita terminalis]|nr:hypothetical protein FQR65_LT01907 [Abscondita terminalis]
MLFSVVSQTPTSEEMIKAWHVLTDPLVSKCACASGAKLSDIRALGETFKYPNIPCLKCYAKCIYYKLGHIDYEGNLIEENFLKDALGVTPAVAAMCKNKTNAILDLCEKMYEFDKCCASQVIV